MVVGCLGDIIFQVSEETTETLQGTEWSGEARYAVHQRHLQNALTEFTGIEPDKISFSMQLTPLLGADIIGELVKIWTYERIAPSTRKAMSGATPCWQSWTWSCRNI